MLSDGGLLRLYRGATTGLSVLTPALLAWRRRHGKEDPARMGERSGIASRPRPAGRLSWLHGASVGEATALLPLIEALRANGVQTLLTTGTVTSARLMQSRLPAGAIHQYAPLDVTRFARRFLDHWRPDLALFAESELWPNLMIETSRRGIPLALVNARLSERSSERWKKLPGTIGHLLKKIDLTLAQSLEDAVRFRELGALHVQVSGNLKYDAPALPCDQLQLADFTVRAGARPIWIAASTHDGEESIAMHVHAQLLARWPNLVTIVAPRHPDRAPAIAATARALGLSPLLRSHGAQINDQTCFYIADTIGELGLFYRAAGIAFLGKSLSNHGGQNPIEAAKLSCAILHGPHVENFADVYRELDASGGAIGVDDAQQLAATLTNLFADSAMVRATSRAASETVERLGGATGNIMKAIEPYLLQVRLEQK